MTERDSAADWPAFTKLPDLTPLSGLSEMERRRILGLHSEARAFDSPDVALREWLDKELEVISQMELRAELDTDSEAILVGQFSSIPGFEFLVRSSPAFAQYLNSYLYFGVRFAAGRIADPCADETIEQDTGWNNRPTGLCWPPPCEGVEAESAKRNFQSYLHLSSLHTPEEAADFELWLRGLLPQTQNEAHFSTLALGIYHWASARFHFYTELEKTISREPFVSEWMERPGVTEGGWQTKNPLAARFGVADLYWLAKIFRAEVSPRGMVRYPHRSWLYYLSGARKEGGAPVCSQEEALKIEEVLRAIFDFACDLIQNAVEITERCESERAELPEDHPPRKWTKDWRAVYDKELHEISEHRKERGGGPLDRGVTTSGECGERKKNYWSQRVRTGEHLKDIVSLALSGGGIRSATFSLGVLQGLQELDLLRQVDYLSTVSGGGYIGAWLVGNVRRTHHWLSRMTSWDESIAHLRRYSKYLAPQTGLLSADSWIVWGTWIRNALLIQLTVIAWLAGIIALTLSVKPLFEWYGKVEGNGGSSLLIKNGVLAAVFVTLAFIVARNLWATRTKRLTQHRLAVLLAWLGSFLTAALLWDGATKNPVYSDILSKTLHDWPRWQLPMLGLCLCGIAVSCMWQKSQSLPITVASGILIGALTTAIGYMGLCGVIYLFGIWAGYGASSGWYAYVFGPSLVLLAMTIAVVILIGLTGWNSEDWKREWWTRYGSWLAIYGSASLVVALAAVFGPLWVGKLFDPQRWAGFKWVTVISWIGSMVAGVLSGYSTKTNGNTGRPGASKALEEVARVCGVIFIAGAVLAISTVLRTTISKVYLNETKDCWTDLNALMTTHSLLFTILVLVSCAVLFSWRFNLNVFGLNQFYRNRLVRCYLGATRWKPGWRKPHGFTGFDDHDDLPLAELRHSAKIDPPFRGPFPIVNCSLNLGGSADLDVHTRHSASFSLTPFYCGSEREKVGYAPTVVASEPGYAGEITLGQAISISGAAASPNMGYNTSPLVSVLLTMFNVRLAWWFPNPGKQKWQKDSPRFSLLYLVAEFLGLADETQEFVNVSDGGHFENLGIYELVRRRAKIIIAVDGECDGDLQFGSLGSVIRMCDTDLGAKIDIDVSSIHKNVETRLSHSHCAVGRITYSNGSLGYLIYLKASLTGDEDTATQQYHALHADFPHQSTGNQFYSEDQFESYRRLGHHIARLTFRVAENERDMVTLASKLFHTWAPAAFNNQNFLRHADALDRLWSELRDSPALSQFLTEITSTGVIKLPPNSPTPPEITACMQLLQLMENVFLDLRLDVFWDHADNRGWAMLFTTWAKSPTLREVWNNNQTTFGIRFEYFCGERLGL